VAVAQACWRRHWREDSIPCILSAVDDRLSDRTNSPEPTRRMTVAMVLTILFVAVVLLVMAVAMKHWVIDETP